MSTKGGIWAAGTCVPAKGQGTGIFCGVATCRTDGGRGKCKVGDGGGSLAEAAGEGRSKGLWCYSCMPNWGSAKTGFKEVTCFRAD